MRLHAFSCGRLRSRKNVFVPDADKNELMDAPVPVFLMAHPRGNVLFDTGPHPDVFSDAASRWGGLAKAFQPIGDERSWVVPQLETVGVNPADIQYVINSHLHFDHAGGNQYFPQSIFLVSQGEMDWAKNPESEGKGYFRGDWDHPLDYRPITGEMDVFGDGTVVILPMPGHTPGHQIVRVRLRREGTIILSGDCVPCQENLRRPVVSRNNMDDALALDTIWRVHALMEKEKAFLIHGHDPSQWEQVRTGPAFYS